MKLIFKTLSKGKVPSKIYFIRLPNYYDTTVIPELLDDVSLNCLDGEKIVEHSLMGDTTITNDERKQLDIYGKIVSSPIEIHCDNLLNRV